MASAAYGEHPTWTPARPRYRPTRVVLSWLVSALALLLASYLVPHVTVNGLGGAIVASALIALLNALLPPIVAALRLPYTLIAGFLLVLVLDAVMLRITSEISDGRAISVDSFWWALLTALIASAVMIVLEVIFGTNDDDTYTIRVIQRIAKRGGDQERTDAPGILFLEIDGLALPVLRRAMRDGNAPVMASWVEQGNAPPRRVGDRLLVADGGEPDRDPARLERRRSRVPVGGQADAAGLRLLRAGRLRRDRSAARERQGPAPERRREPGQPVLGRGRPHDPHRQPDGGRAGREPGLPRLLRQRLQRHPRARARLLGGRARAGWRRSGPSGATSGRAGTAAAIYPLLRAAMCVFVRDLIVYGVISDMIKGGPRCTPTFSSYDEVAHHSGLERADTLEALRKLDQQFGRIERARKYAPRPYEIVVLSDHGQTQGATFLQRNGYGLADLVERSLTRRAGGEGGRRRRAASDGRQRAGRGNGHEAEAEEERRLGPRGRCSRLGQPRSGLPDGGAAPPDARGAEQATPCAGYRRCAGTRMSASCSSRRPSRAVALGRSGVRYLRRRAGGGRRRARGLLTDGGRPSPAHGRLRPRRRHHGQQLLRPPA